MNIEVEVIGKKKNDAIQKTFPDSLVLEQCRDPKGKSIHTVEAMRAQDFGESGGVPSTTGGLQKVFRLDAGIAKVCSTHPNESADPLQGRHQAARLRCYP